MQVTKSTMRKMTQLAALACVAFGNLRPADQIVFAELRNSQQIREEINSLRDRVEAIRMDCEKNTRDMTDEEQTEVDAILGSGEGQAFKPGKLARLEMALERQTRIEANQASLALARAAGGTNPGNPGQTQPNLDPPESRIIIPARCVTGRPLKAFSGANAMTEAYMAGRFYLAALFDHEESRQFCKDHGITVVRGAQSGGVDTKGGFLVPSELAATIITLAYKYGRILEYADVRTMTTDTLDVTKEVGDPEAQWMGATGAASENTAVPELDFDYASHKLVANKLGALTKLSSEITVDAIIDMADNITMRLAKAASKQFDKTGFLGTGNAASGGFTGILPALAAGSIYTPANGIVAYSQFTKAMFDAIVGMVDETADDENCAWFVNKKFYVRAMAPIKEAMGGNTGMDITDGSARKRQMFLGYPVVFCSIFPKTQGNIAVGTWLGGFGDLFASLLAGVRKDIQIAISTEAGFTTDQTFIRLIMRGAVKAHDIGDADNGGAFIGIKNAAA